MDMYVSFDCPDNKIKGMEINRHKCLLFFIHVSCIYISSIDQSIDCGTKKKILDISLYLINETPNPCNRKSNA